MARKNQLRLQRTTAGECRDQLVGTPGEQKRIIYISVGATCSQIRSMNCSCSHPRMQLSPLSETSFTEREPLEESDTFQRGVVSAPDHMTLHKVSMQTELLGCLLWQQLRGTIDGCSRPLRMNGGIHRVYERAINCRLVWKTQTTTGNPPLAIFEDESVSILCKVTWGNFVNRVTD